VLGYYDKLEFSGHKYP